MEKYRILVKGIVKKDGKFLVVQKWFDDNIADPYRWEFIDGEAEFGESPDEAVIRIVHEHYCICRQDFIYMDIYAWFRM